MKKIIPGGLLRLLALYVALVLLFMLQRGVFCALYHVPLRVSEWHGLSMDCAMAAYLSVLPALWLALCNLLRRPSLIKGVLKWYLVVVAFLLGLIFSLDAGLYAHWGFRLDTTPIYYFTTSPKAAWASVNTGQAIGGVLAIIIWSVLNYVILWFAALWRTQPVARRCNAWWYVGYMILLFLPIRGGVTVSTMNLSRAYYCDDPKRNHAAVNPAFSLMYSAMHDSNFASQFRLLDEAEASILFSAAKPSPTPDAAFALNAEKPDVYIIILESFSNHLFSSLGGERVAVRLDSVAREGMVWDNFYATGYRTDRAIPAILSALPSQPTVSLLKHTEKAEKLPSLSHELKHRAGYNTEYWYGGDINFANTLAYLATAGYDRIVCDKDFPVGQRLSKWGANDDVLLARVADGLPGAKDAPRLTVIQTQSSHEPFKVPVTNPRYADNERLNVFWFTDSVVGDFLDTLHKTSKRPYLAILVPDHYGVWPKRETIKEQAQRHRVPLIITGTALPVTARGVRHDVGSQPDIAPTLMALLGLDGSVFKFGNNLADPRAPRRAWMADPDEVAVVDETGKIMPLNIDRPSVNADPRVKAYLQTLYTYIGNL